MIDHVGNINDLNYIIEYFFCTFTQLTSNRLKLVLLLFDSAENKITKKQTKKKLSYMFRF